jgi:hypothetical protein
MRGANGEMVAAKVRFALMSVGFLGVGLLGLGLWPITPAAAQQTVRPPARVRVNPLNPGPNAVRQCKFWLAPEPRPSGTVIVPREYCWWERG